MMPAGSGFGYAAASCFGMSRPQRRTIAVECGVQNAPFTIAMIGISFGSGQDARDALLFPLMYGIAFVINSACLVALFRFVLACGLTFGTHRGW